MSEAIVIADGAASALNHLSLIDKAIERGMAPEQLGKIIDVVDRIREQNAKAAFAQAMTRAQGRMPVVVRDAVNEFTKARYARLETVLAAIKPVYTDEGFSLSFGEGTAETPGTLRVLADVSHTGGHTRQYRGDFPLDDGGMKGGQNKSAVQARGSTFSYARRYLTLLIFNVSVANEDDDGDPAGDRLNRAQVEEVLALIDKCREAGHKTVTKEAICQWLNVKALSELPQRELPKVLAELNHRLKGSAK